MALSYESGIVTFSPGPADIHTHPRILDKLNQFTRADGSSAQIGKAGLAAYTETALPSGITVISAMPNEFFHVVSPENPNETIIEQFPISTPDRAKVIMNYLATESRIKASFNLGVSKEILSEDGKNFDRERLRMNFRLGGAAAAALKVFGDESTGGQQIPIMHIPEMVIIWNQEHQNKPVILHLEDGNVRTVLEELATTEAGMKSPVHIAHISSREELEAVIEAKERGQNVTCEVTPHHLFLTSDDVQEIGGYGCMKPTLKTSEDIAFIRANMRYIDIFASDCAPHSVPDKEAEKPAFGVTNHTTMMPQYLGAVEEGWLTLEDLYEKIVVNPRKRFNLPLENDNTVAVFDMNSTYLTAEVAEKILQAKYGQNIFKKLEEVGKQTHMAGKLQFARSGQSEVRAGERLAGGFVAKYRTDLSHLIQLEGVAV